MAIAVGATAAVVPAAHAGRAPDDLAGSVDATGEVVATRSAAVDVRDYRRRVRIAVNHRRVDRGRVKLASDGCLQRRAVWFAQRLADRDAFFHSDMGDALAACDLTLVGESLALGHTKAIDTARAWMRSPGHRANMLDRRHRLTGVGMARGPSGWITVQLYGRR